MGSVVKLEIKGKVRAIQFGMGVAFLLAAGGCSRSTSLYSSSNHSQPSYNDEVMYDLAAQFQNLAQSADGYVKFRLPPEKADGINGEELLEQIRQNMPQKLAPFIDYTVHAKVEGSNVVLLLCDSDVALIEDAGCNYRLDKTLWKKPTKNSCRFTINSGDYCQ
jgi:hypothetical protein